MGFWNKLFGRKDVPTVEMPVSFDTPPLPQPTATSLADLEKQVDALLFDLGIHVEATATDIEAEKKRKRSEAAKKAAATRAANKAKNK